MASPISASASWDRTASRTEPTVRSLRYSSLPVTRTTRPRTCAAVGVRLMVGPTLAAGTDRGTGRGGGGGKERKGRRGRGEREGGEEGEGGGGAGAAAATVVDGGVGGRAGAREERGGDPSARCVDRGRGARQRAAGGTRCVGPTPPAGAGRSEWTWGCSSGRGAVSSRAPACCAAASRRAQLRRHPISARHARSIRHIGVQ